MSKMEERFLTMIWMRRVFKKRGDRKVTWLVLERRESKKTRRKGIFKVCLETCLLRKVQIQWSKMMIFWESCSVRFQPVNRQIVPNQKAIEINFVVRFTLWEMLRKLNYLYYLCYSIYQFYKRVKSILNKWL